MIVGRIEQLKSMQVVGRAVEHEWKRPKMAKH